VSFDPSSITDPQAIIAELAEPSGVAFMPRVFETTGTGEREYDLFSRLLKDRIIFIGSGINDRVANLIVAQLLFLQMDDKHRDISIYLNSPGGDVTAGLAIYDTMQFVQCNVATYCVGSAASMGAILLAGGTKGKRYALPHSRIMIHQPWGQVHGTALDIEILANEINWMKRRLNEILAHHSGQSYEAMAAATDRDKYLSSREAQEFGLIDEVVESLKDEKE
jgi:ATP-dependent Clp protease protease subunit